MMALFQLHRVMFLNQNSLVYEVTTVMASFALNDSVLNKIEASFDRCLFPRPSEHDITVPVFTGDVRFAHYWLEAYSRWAVQEGLSADQTLVLAVEHMFDNLYEWGRQFLLGMTWEDFIQAFYQQFVTPDPVAITRIVGWYQRLKESSTASTIRFSYRELQVATDNFSSNNLIGEGGLGLVYQGWLSDDRHVAVKKLKHVNTEFIHEMHTEVQVLSDFKHPNLVKLIGSCLEARDPLLVFEYIPNGNLRQHLSGELGLLLPWETRLGIAFGVADAMTHLHYCGSSPVYHEDIKSSNILLDNEFNAKVGDFGLSKFAIPDNSHHTATPQGTLGYIDPCYLQTHDLTAKSDVYSFGVLLLELISGLKAMDLSRPKGEITIASLALGKIKSGHFEDIVDPHLKNEGESYEDLLKIVTMLAGRCLSLDVEARPTMKEVAEELLILRGNWDFM